ncbi:hypothetical protein [Natronoglycomyces albus]|uniref:Uncharacterized protein n=1 Tax=Natronoglycomyces albus TaxID=2811108 RepID=A0A895XN96_9ACTN|nr:hypothetical protein [Natronoglycomyces albus]QSB05252.1 hypothetical protein JQS30_16100 [Natronoglycomyces albus]
MSSADRPEILPQQGVFREEFLAAYSERPRGSGEIFFDPTEMKPRWKHGVWASVVVVALLVAGLMYPVQGGTAAVLAGADHNSVVLAMADDNVPEVGSTITITVGDVEIEGRVSAEQEAEDPAPHMLLVDLVSSSPLSESDVGTPATIQQGVRPILIDIITRGAL